MENALFEEKKSPPPTSQGVESLALRPFRFIECFQSITCAAGENLGGILCSIISAAGEHFGDLEVGNAVF